jgi:ferric-dicitrate binding protein FerR (iron transport regulator)
VTCRNLDRVVLLDSVRFSEEEALALETHAASCRECSAMLARVRSIKKTALTQRTAVPPAGARVEIWERLEARSGRGVLGLRAVYALAAFATVAAALLMFYRSPPPPPAVEVAPMAAGVPEPEDDSIRVTGGRLYPEAGAKWTVEDDGLAVKVVIESGMVEIEVEAAHAFEVATADARIHVLASRFSVARKLEGTEVRVDRGAVDVWPRGRTTPLALAEGKSVLIVEAVEEAKPKTPAKRAAPDAAAELKVARDVLSTDAPRAAEIAERVLERRPTGELEAEALAVLADAERRRGKLREALTSYGKLRDHPRGRGYAEEAMLQRAMLFERLDDDQPALAELDRLELTYPRGASAPERVALAAKIHLEKNDPRKAAQVILAAELHGTSRVFTNRCIEVARALRDLDPALAEKVLLKGSTPPGNEPANLK